MRFVDDARPYRKLDPFGSPGRPKPAGWSQLRAEDQPERWLDGCRQAIAIMDGDNGRDLTRNNRPLTNLAKEVRRRFTNYPSTLYVLKRCGIENYIPKHSSSRT